MRKLSVVLVVSLSIAGCGGGGSNNSPSPTAANVTPNLIFNVNKTEIVSGQNVTLNWNATNTSNCVASGSWTGNKANTGSEDVKVLSGTNTFTINCTGTSSSVTVNGLPYAVTIVHSDTPSYANSVATTTEIVRGIKNAGYSITFVQGGDSKNNIFTFPLAMDKLMDMPPFQLVETSTNKFSFVKFYEDVKIGSPRAWSRVGIKNSNSKGVVLVDHGQEIGPQHTWQLGDVYVMSEKSNTFQFQKISNSKAFHHSVAVGDINDDGSEDVVVSHLGNGSHKLTESIQTYVQTVDGSFKNNPFLSTSVYNASVLYSSAGAVGLADLDGDGNLEGIQANYTFSSDTFNNWGAIRIYKKNFVGTYVIDKTIPRENNYSYMGASEVTTFDFDNDKDLDILVTLEGTCTNKVGEYTCMALELYRNDGNLIFTRITDSVFTQSKFSNTTDIVFGSIEIVDFNKDGFKDIYLEYGSPAIQIKSNTLDFGKYLLKNDQGKGFKSMSDTTQFTLNFKDNDSVPTALRLMDSNVDVTRMFGFTTNGAPTVVAIQAGK